MLPFYKFIATQYFFNKDVEFISKKLKQFGYSAKDDEIKGVLADIYNILPPSISDLMKSRAPLSLLDETHTQWLQHFGVFDFYHYIASQGVVLADPPPYIKWFDDCMWIHSHRDIMSLVNIFLFNEEPDESICDIVQFKYKKKIGIQSLTCYKEIFWNTKDLTAKDAFEYCMAFRDSAVAVRTMRLGVAETGLGEESADGCDVSVSFHGSDYIKWKIGYKKIKAPSAVDFFEQVKTDAAFKYYEAINMSQHVEISTEEGNGGEFGSYDKKVVHRKNVEDSRVKQAKAWVDIYTKAYESAPKQSTDSDANFFDKLEQVSLEFDVCDEQIVSIDDNADILEDVKNDISKGVA